MRRTPGMVMSLLLVAGVVAGVARAEVPVETTGRVEVLPQPPGAHWAWVSDVLLRRSALLDLDRGVFLGMISTGFLSPTAVFSPAGDEFYLPETYYSRGSRGERIDVVTVYDTRTLGAVGEVVIPPKRAVNVLVSGNAALSDDGRFLAVSNMTPATSLSIVDLRERRFAGEIATPGCTLVFAAGPRSFFSLCTDGSLLSVGIDDRGRESGRAKGGPFFDPQRDPVTEKAVRFEDTWLFVSFEGRVHPVDVSGPEPVAGEPWSLLSEPDRAGSWRIGGSQHLAVHAGRQRLYSLMHQGGSDTHKEPGTELWVYDLGSRERVQRIALRHPGLAFLSETIEFGQDWPWPFGGLWGWTLDHVVPNPGINLVAVTPDPSPLLVTGSQMGGSVAVYDAVSGEFLRRVSSGNFTSHVLQAPWGGGPP